MLFVINLCVRGQIQPNFPDAVQSIVKSGFSETANIVFERYGEANSSNPVIIPAEGIGNEDYGIHISGADYVTFDGIDIQQVLMQIETTIMFHGLSLGIGLPINRIMALPIIV